MLIILGWLALLIPLCWITIACYFTTIPVFGETLFTGKWYKKLLGIIFWIVVFYAWHSWLSVISIDINPTTL